MKAAVLGSPIAHSLSPVLHRAGYRALGIDGQWSYDRFEVDEAALPDVAAHVRPRALCLGNLFRDQLDRYGELELVAERWRAAAAVFC